MKNNGFIKLHRSFKDWYGSKDPMRTALWIHLLLLVNHEPQKWLFKGSPYCVKRGQCITSRISLADITGISQSRLERLLKEFQKEGQIEQQTTNRNRLITITNYNKYQQYEQQQGQQKDNKRTTEGQQKDTNKNDKNDKNDKNKPSLENISHYCLERKNTIDPETFFDYYESSGWIKANGQKVKDWKATIRTWEKQNIKNKPKERAMV